jgi:4-diphosphocytidyl-2C-methyl-D-erythritol kinase
VNDLESAAFSVRPELGELRRAAERSIGRPVRMSGSGSSLFTLFDAGEDAEARAAAERVGRELGVTAVAVGLAPDAGDDLAPAA